MARLQLLRPRRFTDERGWFSETYSRRAAAEAGIADAFVQDNHSLSRAVGTVRGLHFQLPPDAQSKLVRCLRGRIMDVAVDIRRGSPTYGRAVGTELTAEGGSQLFVPVGFAHGFVTLEPDTEVAYKVSAPYVASSESGIRFDDPALGIDWPLPASGAVLSPRDRQLPLLSAFDSPFPYDGQPMPPALD